MKYYYDKYQIIKYYEKTSSWGTEQAKDDGNWPNARVLVHYDYYFSSSTGRFSGSGGSKEIFYEVLGDSSLPRYYVTSNWVMYIDSAAANGYNVEIKGSKTTSLQRSKQGDLITENLIAEDGTYPKNGKHTDGFWYVKKGLANTPPSISGKDESLGNISDEINYNYTVFDEDNDTLSIVERLNNRVINVRNDVKSGTEFTLNIPKEDIYKLPIGQANKISIEVSDGQEKVYRNLTFIRTNTAPVIQVLSAKELGDIITPFTSKIKVTDEEGDKVNLVYTVNQIVLDKNKEYKRVPIHSDNMEDITLDTEISYSIPVAVFKTMNIGDYELSIKAIDAEQGENEEVIKFTRTEDTIDFTTRSIETEVMPKQFISLIQITGTPSNIKIMACNNGLDSNPAWENITDYALDGSPYNFKNTSKTAAKWAVKAQVCLDGREVE